MKLIITDIRILSKLMEAICKKSIGNTDIRIYAILSALPSSQRVEAEELALQEAITLVELEENIEETMWLADNMCPAISMDQLIAIRYALLNDIVLLTDDKVLCEVAQRHKVKVVDCDGILFHPSFWKNFKSQIIQLNRVAVLL